MRLFKRKDRVIDLTKKYKEDQERAKRISASSESSETSPLGGGFGIFGNANSSSTANSNSGSNSSSEGYVDFSSGSEGDDRKKKLAKRLMDMTDKLEDISNQIYHLQQRIEVVERKMNVGGY